MLNQCNFIGNVGKKPEIRTTKNGKKVASFSIACNESWRDSSGQKKEKVEWVNIVVFSEGLVNLIELYLEKGSKIYVSGQLQTRKWQDQSGQDRYTTEIVLQNYNGTLTMLDSKPNNNTQDEPVYANKPEDVEDNELNDDIPF